MVRVLIVDTNILFRRTLMEILTSGYGAQADEAADGDEAFEKMERDKPDIVFVDVRLHGENGWLLARRLKDLHPRTVVVVISGLDSEEYKEAAFAYGADIFISKNSGTIEEIEAAMGKLTLQSTRTG